MNLSNFRKDVSSKIYERGYEYFEDGCIADLQELNEGEWLAEVEGNYDDYTVEIKLDENNIKSWRCNCPYDGAICKHVVAVLLSINEEKKLPKSKSDKKKPTPEWISIIDNTPEKELRSFLLDYAKKNKNFQDELIINLSKSPKEINIGKYQNIIAHTFNAMAGRYGYIEYSDTYAAMHPVHNMLDKADEYISSGNYHEAFSIAAAVAPECIEAIEYMDDSNGECGGTINEAFDIADRILNECNDAYLADTIFEWLLEQVQDKTYDDYGCADELEPIFFRWANTPVRLKLAYQFIEAQLTKHKGSDDWSAQYHQTKYLKYKTELLLNEGKKDEAEQLINSHLHLSDFRKMKIEQALNNSDFESAIAHIEAGIVQAKKDDYPGIVHQFKDQLLDIYKKLKGRNKIRELSKELFLENQGDINYYRSYKNTFEPKEWPAKCEEIIQKITKRQVKTFWGIAFQSELASVFIEEKMWGRLLKEVQQVNRIEITDRYSKYLKNDYPSEMIALYKNSILKYAENTGRNIYADIVGYLKTLAKFKGGKAVAQNLMNSLLEQYKNRPAMKDEFRKLNW